MISYSVVRFPPEILIVEFYVAINKELYQIFWWRSTIKVYCTHTIVGVQPFKIVGQLTSCLKILGINVRKGGSHSWVIAASENYWHNLQLKYRKKFLCNVIITKWVLKRKIKLVILLKHAVTISCIVTITAKRTAVSVHIDLDVLCKGIRILFTQASSLTIWDKPRYQFHLFCCRFSCSGNCHFFFNFF